MAEGFADVLDAVKPQLGNAVERGFVLGREAGHRLTHSVSLDVATDIGPKLGHAADQRAVVVFPVVLKLGGCQTGFATGAGNKLDHPFLLVGADVPMSDCGAIPAGSAGVKRGSGQHILPKPRPIL